MAIRTSNAKRRGYSGMSGSTADNVSSMYPVRIQHLHFACVGLGERETARRERAAWARRGGEETHVPLKGGEKYIGDGKQE